MARAQRRNGFLCPTLTSERAPNGKEHFIWGATAGMLRNFYRFLSADCLNSTALYIIRIPFLYDAGMSFFAIFCALLIEQVKPLTRSNPIHHGLRAWANAVSRNFDAGKAHHGWVVWGHHSGLASLWRFGDPLVFDLTLIGWPAAVVWNVVVLYVTLGFRQFSYHFTDIRDALDSWR